MSYITQMDIQRIQDYLKELQNSLCNELTLEDGLGFFMKDDWERPLADEADGVGCTAILKNGAVIEQGGVNYSHIRGKKLPPAASVLRKDFKEAAFEAMGVSSVIHPNNPFVPTAHLNVRFFLAKLPDDTMHWWFGGGFDLTPFYPFEEDCVHWHTVAKNACDPFGLMLYPKFKKQCDDYFFIKHRNERRGIGGIFFDDFNQLPFEESFAFMRSVGDSFIKAYQPIIARRKNHPYHEKHKAFQLYRRGRYVEFNLVYDRGTLFGLQSNGRIESILMSMPPMASWQYDFKIAPDSEEAKLATYLHPL